MSEIKSGGAILIMLMTLLIAFIVFALQGASWMPPQGASLHKLYIDGVPLSVEVADDVQEQKLGLVGRASLPKDRGMLFIFAKQAKWRVTTKNMHFPIDIFWIAGSGEIVDIQKYASGVNAIFAPSAPAQYILETNADFASIYNIEVGDQLSGI